jgi:succinate dehydrogenase / fumarate reductase, flavoprotein subunit
VFGKRAGEYAAEFAKQNGASAVNMNEVERSAAAALAAFNRSGENPFQVQHDLQGMMQDLVGIVRREEEMQRALEGLFKLKQRAETVSVPGNREYNNGWHTALDLHHLLSVSEMTTRAAIERQESRGAHFRDDYPAKNEAHGLCNIIVRRSDAGEMQIAREPLKDLPPELRQVIDEMK